MPLRIACREASPYVICLAMGLCLLLWLIDDREDVVFLHDEQVLAVEADLLPRVLAEQHLVAGLHVERDRLAVFRDAAAAGRDDDAALRLLLGAFGGDDAANLLLPFVQAVHDDAVVQGANVHDCVLAVLTGAGGWLGTGGTSDWVTGACGFGRSLANPARRCRNSRNRAYETPTSRAVRPLHPTETGSLEAHACVTGSPASTRC